MNYSTYDWGTISGEGVRKTGITENCRDAKSKVELFKHICQCRAGNTVARAVYEKMGFQDTGKIIGQKSTGSRVKAWIVEEPAKL
ncbi:MAG: hypothetical protein ACFFBD_23685 [Candidatus Hodarchaeota archaeon]